MTKDKLIDAFWAGEIGEVEFFEVGLDLGMDTDEIGQVLSDVREEDGTL